LPTAVSSWDGPSVVEDSVSISAARTGAKKFRVMTSLEEWLITVGVVLVFTAASFIALAV
jgi:hypothetical protein